MGLHEAGNVQRCVHRMSRDRKKLLVACPRGRVFSGTTLSGYPSFLVPELSTHFDVEIADGLSVPKPGFSKRIRNRLQDLLGLRAFRYTTANVERARSWSDWLESRIAESQPDAVLSLFQMSVAFLKTSVPVFMYLDAVYRYKTILNPDEYCYDDLSVAERNDIDAVDHGSLKCCKRAFFMSSTIAETCKKLYPTYASKISTVGVGANIETKEAVGRRRVVDGGEVCILFVASSFERKGGDTALEACRLLRENGIRVRLRMLGDLPKQSRVSKHLAEHQDWIEYRGWVNKELEKDKAYYYDTLEESHIHLLPTRYDTNPHVICEANAYGIPTVARSIGGIPDVVLDRVTGILVSSSDPKDYADGIKQVIADYDIYSANARSLFIREQNWALVAGRIASEIHAAL